MVMIASLICFCTRSVRADDTSFEGQTPPEKRYLDAEEDDTPDIDTESTVDDTEDVKDLTITGDIRALFDFSDTDGRDGKSSSDSSMGGRIRLRADLGITETVHLGARVAGRGFTNEFEPEFVLQMDAPASNGLEGGQVTLDELYLHWFRTERASFAFGRLQTRFVLRGGVFARSLDRRDSAGTNITWTDGLQATYRAQNGWESSFVLQGNSDDGSGSVRRSPLDFDDSGARNTYFLGFENTKSWGPIVQRAFDVSYLPASLLKDGVPSGRREDYWGLVGRLAFRWPKRAEGVHLRVGTEIGYAPAIPSRGAVNLDTDVSGLAWDVVASVMDFRPGHSLGINYAQTGAGWLLSPSFRPNEELFEIRYQWHLNRSLMFEARLRWREDLEKPIGAIEKREQYDMFMRLTWRFTARRR